MMNHMEKYRTVYRWKCQKCGQDWWRIIKDEPRLCPVCRDMGAKTFEGKEKRYYKKN